MEEVLLFPPLSGAAVCLGRSCAPTNQADGGWELRHVLCAQNPLLWLWGAQLPCVCISGALVQSRVHERVLAVFGALNRHLHIQTARVV